MNAIIFIIGVGKIMTGKTYKLNHEIGFKGSLLFPYISTVKLNIKPDNYYD